MATAIFVMLTGEHMNVPKMRLSSESDSGMTELEDYAEQFEIHLCRDHGHIYEVYFGGDWVDADLESLADAQAYVERDLEEYVEENGLGGYNVRWLAHTADRDMWWTVEVKS